MAEWKIVNSYGNEIGYQKGSDYVINDESGSRLGWINGINDIINNNGAKVGEVRSNGVFDVYGSRVGDVTGDNILWLLIPKGPPTPSSDTHGFLAVVLLGFIKALWSYIKGPFVEFSYLGDTATRKEWWGTCIRSILLSLLIGSLLIGLIVKIIPGFAGTLVALLFWLAFGLLPIIAVSIRRMHDIGKNGWWSLIPIVGFVMCGFFPGKIEGNKYI